MTTVHVSWEALRMKVRRCYEKDGLAFHLSGRSASQRRRFGTWFVTDARGRIKYSARGAGKPDESLEEHALGLGLVREWDLG